MNLPAQATGGAHATRAVLVAADGEASTRVRVWGLSARERLERGLRRAGIEQIETLERHAPGTPAGEQALVIRADFFYDERLLRALVAAPEGTALRVGSERVAARVASASVTRWPFENDPQVRDVALEDLVPAYDPRLRKRAVPFVLPAEPGNVRAVENRIFAAAYKDTTDVVTRWIWPLPARAVTRFCVRHGISPNTVTAASYALTAVATLSFALGDRAFGLGLAAAWLMTFLDTVDGKLARTTLTSSRLGHVLDHGLDLVHPPIWWAAFAWGLAGDRPLGQQEDLVASLAIVVGGYLVGRLLEGVFMLAFGIEMFIWRPFDRLFRLVIARRNPNLVLLTLGVATGHPRAGFHAVAAWTLGSIAIQLVRIAQALRCKRAGRPIRSFYVEAGGGG